MNRSGKQIFGLGGVILGAVDGRLLASFVDNEERFKVVPSQ